MVLLGEAYNRKCLLSTQHVFKATRALGKWVASRQRQYQAAYTGLNGPDREQRLSAEHCKKASLGMGNHESTNYADAVDTCVGDGAPQLLYRTFVLLYVPSSVGNSVVV